MDIDLLWSTAFSVGKFSNQSAVDYSKVNVIYVYIICMYMYIPMCGPLHFVYRDKFIFKFNTLLWHRYCG